MADVSLHDHRPGAGTHNGEVPLPCADLHRLQEACLAAGPDGPERIAAGEVDDVHASEISRAGLRKVGDLDGCAGFRIDNPGRSAARLVRARLRGTCAVDDEDASCGKVSQVGEDGTFRKPSRSS